MGGEGKGDGRRGRARGGVTMTPELTALESALAGMFREVSTAGRIADMAGLDVAQIDRTGSSADVWHSIIDMAIQDGVLDALVDRARIERPRNKELLAAYEAYKAAQPPAQPKRKRPPQGQDGAHLSDYRADERRDARIDQMQRDMADMREKMAGLVVQVTTLTELVKSQGRQNRSSLTDGQFAAVLVSFIIIALVVFAVVYYGGNQ